MEVRRDPCSTYGERSRSVVYRTHPHTPCHLRRHTHTLPPIGRQQQPSMAKPLTQKQQQQQVEEEQQARQQQGNQGQELQQQQRKEEEQQQQVVVVLLIL